MKRSSQYSAYRAASHTVGKTRQIVMLYDGAIRFLQQAREAMQEKRIEERYNLLTKVSAIFAGLQTSLDFEAGYQIASTLHDFYSDMDARIVDLHRSNDLESCSKIIEELREMRNVWDEIDQSETPATGSSLTTSSEAPATNETTESAGETSDEATPVSLTGVIVSA